MRKLIASILLLSLAICLFACKKPVEEPEQVEKPEQTLNYKYNPNNPSDGRSGFFYECPEGKTLENMLTIRFRNYASLNYIYKEFTPADFPEIDCVKVVELEGWLREEALNIITNPLFNPKENVVIKNLKDFMITLRLYLKDDSFEHLKEMGQLLYDEREEIESINIYPTERGGWMSGDSTI